jgi:phosphoribosylanthranilate isomerase
LVLFEIWNLEFGIPMNIRVKICGITRLQDALDACGFGADLLGFNFVPESKRYINPYSAREIIASLPPFVMRVGIFADEELRVVNDLAQFLNLDAVQLHGNEDSAYCSGVQSTVIKAVRVSRKADLDGFEIYDVPALLLDSKVEGTLGGSGRSFPWEMASDLCVKRRIFLAGGLTPSNVRDAVRILSPFGVDTASGVEIEPGVKDRALMKKFISAAKCAAMENGGDNSDIAC